MLPHEEELLTLNMVIVCVPGDNLKSWAMRESPREWTCSKVPHVKRGEVPKNIAIFEVCIKMKHSQFHEIRE